MTTICETKNCNNEATHVWQLRKLSKPEDKDIIVEGCFCDECSKPNNEKRARAEATSMNLEDKKEYIKFREQLLTQTSDSLLSVSKLCIDELNLRRIALKK